MHLGHEGFHLCQSGRHCGIVCRIGLRQGGAQGDMQYLAILGVVDAVAPVHCLDGVGQSGLACEVQQQFAGFGRQQILRIVQKQCISTQAEVCETLWVFVEKLGDGSPGGVQIQVMRSEFLP